MTSCINPETFVTLDHGIYHKPGNVDRWVEMCDWCLAHIGERSIDWYADGGDGTGLPPRWWFRTREQLVLFQLTWL